MVRFVVKELKEVYELWKSFSNNLKDKNKEWFWYKWEIETKWEEIKAKKETFRWERSKALSPNSSKSGTGNNSKSGSGSGNNNTAKWMVDYF